MAEKHVKKLPAPSGADGKLSSILFLYFYNKCMKHMLLNQNLPSMGKERTITILCSCEKQARSEFFAMVPSAALSLLSDRHYV